MPKPNSHSSKPAASRPSTKGGGMAHPPSSGKDSHRLARPAARSEARSVRPSARGASGRSAKNDVGFQWNSISPERKLDILGILLALMGLLTLLSLISFSRGSVTGAWLELLRSVAGWGTFVLPVALVGVGLWLVFRNIDRLPQISGERLSGIFFLYLNILAWAHLLAGGGWELAATGLGGGYVGAIFERALTGALGVAGSVVVLAAWFLVALAMALDLSIPDLFRIFKPLVQRLRRPLQENKQPDAADKTLPGSVSRQGILTEPPRTMGDLPPGFHPLPPLNGKVENSRPGPQPVKAPSNGNKNTAPAAGPEEAGNNNPAGEPTLAGSTPAPATPNWVLPSVEAILDPGDPVSAQGSVDQERAHVIEETLASFGAPGHIVDIQNGPTITLYAVEPDYVETRNGRTRVRVSKIVSLADDLALALAASRIRIQAPVPGRAYVGIEVPNAEISRVALRDVMESDAFKKVKSPLKLALGKNVSGAPVCADMAAMPHMLIAGTTGSGKSVCVNSILCALLLNNSPADLRLVLVDPKRVELTGYNGIPHLLAPVVVDAERVIGALQWMLREMDARYHRFAQAAVRNIQEYNKLGIEHLPYLVIIIDELADLMMLAPDETERSITRLAQLARATGIHLILATQRPSVDVVTGLIKANFPARIAFAVASGVDSRVILDQPGAERLLGRGDMLFQAPDAPAPVRLQGVYVSDSEIQRLVETWRVAAQSMPAGSSASASDLPIDMPPAGVPLKQTPLFDGIEVQEGDPLLSEAIDLVRREGRASISMLQRRMRIGYTRSARLVDRMEEMNIIGPSLANSQVREVLDYGNTAPPPEKPE